ncbi:MAG: flagellar filament capping protein FliD [Myxococcales bacterium]|nr:flagellar filament capping protein FliD [Myxococcales bacterium]
MITFGGLASGLDTGAIIDALVEASRQPINRLQTKKSDYNHKISALSDVMNKLSTLQKSAEALDKASELASFSAKSSNEDVLKATASSSATAGSYDLTVNTLASAERTYSDTFASKDTTAAGFGAGTLSITVGSAAAVDITIDDSTQTLEDVAAAINSSSAAVSANVIYDGSNYRLVVQGDETGAANAITFSESGTLALNLDEVANERQAATDASVTFDGITVTSATNSLSGAIPGLTLEVYETTATPVTVTIDSDFDAVSDKVQSFVDDYNAVIEAINKQFSFSGEARTDTLMGDASLRSAKRQLQQIVSTQVSGTGSTYDALSRVGVTTERDGTLSFSSSKLKEALAADFQGVSDLFALTDGDDQTANDGVAVTMARQIESMLRAPDGTLQVRKDGLGDSVSDIDDRISMLERRADSYEEGLVRQFTALEQLMSGIQNQGNFLASYLGG